MILALFGAVVAIATVTLLAHTVLSFDPNEYFVLGAVAVEASHTVEAVVVGAGGAGSSTSGENGDNCQQFGFGWFKDAEEESYVTGASDFEKQMNAIQVTVDDNCGHSFCEPFAETVFKGASTPCALCKEPVTKKICNPTCVFGARWRDCASAAVSIQKDAALPASLEKGDWWEKHEGVCTANSAHKEECKLTRGTDSMVACKFAVLGCPFESKRSASKDAEQHMIEHTNKHLEMLSGEVEEGGKGYLMEYVLLSEQTHLSEKRTMADGTQVWFKIKPENNDFYNLVVCVNKKKYLQFTANEKEGSCASSSPNPTTGRGWAYWLKAEPGTLLKVEVSNIMAASRRTATSAAQSAIRNPPTART
eukprot:g60245.t1